MKLHTRPECLVQVVENALQTLWERGEDTRWSEVYDFYEKRYLNPDSPEKQTFYRQSYYYVSSLPPIVRHNTIKLESRVE